MTGFPFDLSPGVRRTSKSVAVRPGTFLERFLVCCLWLAKNLQRAVQDSGVFQVYYAAVRAWLQVKFDYLAVLIIMGAKIVAHGLFLQVQVMGDAVDAAVRERVFDAAKLFESNVHNL